ncbi:MAG: hypothetical protein IKQ71_01215 [Lachnospiraceae bacterium]|nr:hypothetical protein [Lachnospiraceae bacterium]
MRADLSKRIASFAMATAFACSLITVAPAPVTEAKDTSSDKRWSLQYLNISL